MSFYVKNWDERDGDYRCHVIAIAGPLIALGKLNRLDLLAALYSKVNMPAAVYDEVVRQGSLRGEPDAARVKRFWQRQAWPVTRIGEKSSAIVEFSTVLGLGEREALTLALHQTPALVLMDDATARAEAKRLGILVRGTLGIVVQAVRTQYLSLDEAESLIDEVEAHSDIWISPLLCRAVARELQRYYHSDPE